MVGCLGGEWVWAGRPGDGSRVALLNYCALSRVSNIACLLVPRISLWSLSCSAPDERTLRVICGLPKCERQGSALRERKMPTPAILKCPLEKETKKIYVICLEIYFFRLTEFLNLTKYGEVGRLSCD